MTTQSGHSRRQFLLAGTATGTGLVTAALVGNIKAGETTAPAKSGSQPGEDISPPEDLMREHGVLNRILLVYEECLRRLHGHETLDTSVVVGAAKIVRTFIEDYHEKQEEEFVFPRFEKAGKLVDLVTTLRQQHQAGRRLTEQITKLAIPAVVNDAEGSRELARAISRFSRIYRPHEAREDTVLFPALRTVVTAKEFDEMGDRFEDREHQLFGQHGFEGIVDQVAELEKKLSIYDLSQFTPKT